MILITHSVDNIFLSFSQFVCTLPLEEQNECCNSTVALSHIIFSTQPKHVHGVTFLERSLAGLDISRLHTRSAVGNSTLPKYCVSSRGHEFHIKFTEEEVASKPKVKGKGSTVTQRCLRDLKAHPCETLRGATTSTTHLDHGS